MSTSQAIRENVIADFIAVLTPGVSATVFREGIKRSGDVLPAVSVGEINRYVSIINEDAGATGFWRIDILIDCLSHVQDDPTSAVVNELEKEVLDTLNIDGILTALNNQSAYNTYKALSWGVTDEYIEGHIRHLGLPITVRMCPTTTNITTTTTTTTT